MISIHFSVAIVLSIDLPDGKAESNMEEWEASTPALLQSKLVGMYNLLADGNVSTMKLLSSNGVLPGSGGSGARYTYKPSSQTCSNGCGLDGNESACGPLGNSDDPDPCSNVGSPPITSCVATGITSSIISGRPAERAIYMQRFPQGLFE